MESSASNRSTDGRSRSGFSLAIGLMIESRSGGYDRVHGRARRWTAASGIATGEVAGPPLRLALAILVAVLGAFVLVRAVMLRGAVLPGVNVAGIDVGGLSRADARAKIEATLGANLGRPVTVVVGTREFTTRPSRLYELDVAATEAAAYAEARGSFLSRLTSIVLPFAADREVDPVLRVIPRGPPGACGATERADQARRSRRGLRCKTSRPWSSRGASERSSTSPA